MDRREFRRIKKLLDEKEKKYNNPDFILTDPVSIPHSFSLKQDIEIMGLFAAVLAWGQRKTIINKCKELSARMDNNPYDFILHHQEKDLKQLLGFKHRTFNDFDLLYFINFLNRHYSVSDTLETAFAPYGRNEMSIEFSLIYFYNYFFLEDVFPLRTRKHISSPAKKSACKRINMYLRWMVRDDSRGVDFGLWKKIKPKNLICPIDVHVERTARLLGLLQREKVDWLAAKELTENLKLFDPKDPVKYDFSLFGMSIENEF